MPPQPDSAGPRNEVGIEKMAEMCVVWRREPLLRSKSLLFSTLALKKALVEGLVEALVERLVEALVEAAEKDGPFGRGKERRRPTVASLALTGEDHNLHPAEVVRRPRFAHPEGFEELLVHLEVLYQILAHHHGPGLGHFAALGRGAFAASVADHYN